MLGQELKQLFALLDSYTKGIVQMSITAIETPRKHKNHSEKVWAMDPYNILFERTNFLL